MRRPAWYDTPGALYVRTCARDAHVVLTVDGGREVAVCRSREAAELFAAAPDLLDVCRRLWKAQGPAPAQPRDDEDPGLMEACRAALERVTPAGEDDASA